MSDMVIICSPEAANGFRLAGITVREAKDAEETLKVVKDLREKMKSGLVVLPEEFVAEFSKRDQKELESGTNPLFVTVPLNWREIEDPKSKFSEIVKNIVGFKVPMTSQILKTGKYAQKGIPK